MSMQTIQTLQTWVIPLLAYSLGVLGAWLVVRMPAVNPAAIAKNDGSQARRLSRIVLWVILAGLIATPLEFTANVVLSWIGTRYAPSGALPKGAALSLVAFCASLVLGYTLAWWLFRRVDWTGIAADTGWHPTRRQRLLLLLAFGMLLTWPVIVSAQIGVNLMRDTNVLLAGDVRFARQVRFLVAQLIVAYGLGLWMAGSVLRQIGSRPRQLFREGGSRFTSFVLFITLAGVLAEGVLHLLNLLDGLFRPLLYPPLFGGGEPLNLGSSPLDVAVMRLDPVVLPLLAYLPAFLVVRRIDWQAIGDRAGLPVPARQTGWRPLRPAKALVFLTLGAWLAWPFGLLRQLVLALWPEVQPLFVTARHLLFVPVIAVLVYLLFLYSPGDAGGAWEPAE